MQTALLPLLRCPFCGTALELIDNAALVRHGDQITSAVIGCQCCAFPIVDGIPVLIADDRTRDAMHALEAGHADDARDTLLGLDEAPRREAFRALLARGAGATYKEALEILSPDAEGTYFVYRFSDPTYLMSQAVLRALGAQRRITRPVIDVCGGSGHLTRDLVAAAPGASVVLADVFYWKLWLGRHFVAPTCEPVCCDGNTPLPFVRAAFALVVLSDAFPYIWHKRLLADELMRLATPDGIVAMPHLHSALGFNFSAGMTLTPPAYRDLFEPMRPRLFRDSALVDGVLERREVDLLHDVVPETVGDEPAVTLVASPLDDVFRTWRMPPDLQVQGELRINPLYRVAREGHDTVLTLSFPTPEYEEEFGACRRYLPDTVRVAADLTGPITPTLAGPDFADLRRRHVIIDAPLRYY
jgi:uncharacterized protein YbaR (Trm112 family)